MCTHISLLDLQGFSCGTTAEASAAAVAPSLLAPRCNQPTILCLPTAACVCVHQKRATRYQEETRKAVESINAIFTHLGSAAAELLTDTNKLVMVVVGSSALALGVYGAREGTRVAGKALDAWLGTPKLVSGVCVWWGCAGKPVGSTGYRDVSLGLPVFGHGK